MGRTLNETCEQCGKQFYRRPSHREMSKHAYCSRKCYALGKTHPSVLCVTCGNLFHKKRHEQKYCSIKCVTNRPGAKRRKGSVRNSAHARRLLLEETFDTKICMVERCDYGKTLDVHRLVLGKNGGEYVIGNMFLMCPNHHAELHRNITVFAKVNDCVLREC